MYMKLMLGTRRHELKEESDYQPASKIRLVDIKTRMPALTIIRKAKYPLACYVSSDWSEYFVPSEIVEWGRRYGYTFVLPEDVHKHQSADRPGELPRVVNASETPPAPRVSEAASTIMEFGDRKGAPVDVDSLRKLIWSLGRKLDSAQRKANESERKYRELLFKHEEIVKQIQSQKWQPPTELPKNDARPTLDCQAINLPIDIITSKRIPGFKDGLEVRELLQYCTPTLLNRVSGVYFLFDKKGEIVYVGQSNNLVARIGTHLADAKKSPYFCSVAAVALSQKDLLAVEAIYIDKHNPPLNRTTRDKRQARMESNRLARHAEAIIRKAQATRRANQVASPQAQADRSINKK